MAKKQIVGIDLSHWQAKIDYQKLVDNGYRFVFAKAGELMDGATESPREHNDILYERNIREAKEHGILCGAYYFFHPFKASKQASHFLKLLKKAPPDFPPVIDVEVTDGVAPKPLADCLKAMIDQMVKTNKYKDIIIYSRWGFLVNQVGEPEWLKGFDYVLPDGETIHVNVWLWLAQYNFELKNQPKDKTHTLIWQHTDKLRIPGIGVDLDGNRWLKDEELMLKLAGKITEPAPEPEPEPLPEPLPEPEPTPEPELTCCELIVKLLREIISILKDSVNFK